MLRMNRTLEKTTEAKGFNLTEREHLSREHTFLMFLFCFEIFFFFIYKWSHFYTLFPPIHVCTYCHKKKITICWLKY